MHTSQDRSFLRHTLATLAYRAEKTLRDPPEDFGSFRVGPTSRTPAEIVSHLGDLMEWGYSMTEGEPSWSDTTSNDLAEQIERFFASLSAWDDYLASDAEIANPVERLFQGPVADALTHVGQLAMLRRLAGSEIKGENYFKAGIETGRLGQDQPAPPYEFD